MTSAAPIKCLTHLPHGWGWARLGAQLMVTGFAIFWLWFAISVGVSEGLASLPYVLAICLPVAGLPIAAWVWPRFGGILLIAGGILAAWYYNHPAPRLMMALPAIVSGLVLVLTPRSRACR